MRRRADLTALGGYLLVALAFTFPLVLQFTRAIPGDGFDGWQNYWNLWWLKVSLVERLSSPYFTGLLYYPTGVSLLFHTLNPFNGLLSLPVQLAWGLLPAYNFAVLFSFVAGGFGAYLLARAALGRRASWPGAFLAGVVFTFAPYHIAHLLGHLQLIALEWIPFYVLYVLRLAGNGPNEFGGPSAGSGKQISNNFGTPPVPRDTRSPELVRVLPLKDILLAALFLMLVALCDWYYVLYCLIFSAIVLVWLLARTQFRRLARFGISLALVGLVFLLAVSPILVPMLREASQARYMVPDPLQSRTFSADLLAFITPQEFHPLWGQAAQVLASRFTATVAEHQVFAGYCVLLLAALGVWGGRRRRRDEGISGGIRDAGRASGIAAGPWFWLVVLLAFFLLALGPVLHVAGRTALLPAGGEIRLPYAWLANSVPFLNISRSVSRFDVMVMLALALLAAFGAQWLWERGRTGRVAGVAAVILVLFEFWPAPYPLSAPDTPAWYATLAADPRPGAVLNLPANWDRPGYLLYQTVHGKPLTAAYISRDDPRTLIDRAPVLQNFRRLGPDIIGLDMATQGQQVLASLGIRWVVLDRYKMPGARERSYNESTASLIFGAEPPVFSDQRLTVYEVKRLPGFARPYAILGEGWGAYDPETRSRSFTGQATLNVQASEAGPASLRVTLAPGSGLLAAGDGRILTLPLALSPGANQFDLHAAQPETPVVVSHIEVVPG